MNISYPDQLVCFALQVKLADRALLPGDVVKFSDVNQGTQKGFVSNVEVAASVKVLVANQIFHYLDCKELSPLQVTRLETSNDSHSCLYNNKINPGLTIVHLNL